MGEHEDEFERWMKDEGAKNIGLESAKSFAYRVWRAGRAALIRELEQASATHPEQKESAGNGKAAD